MHVQGRVQPLHEAVVVVDVGWVAGGLSDGGGGAEVFLADGAGGMVGSFGFFGLRCGGDERRFFGLIGLGRGWDGRGFFRRLEYVSAGGVRGLL